MKKRRTEKFVTCPRCKTRFTVAISASRSSKRSTIKDIMPLLGYLGAIALTIGFTVLLIIIFG
jgi:hypothetical protein